MINIKKGLEKHGYQVLNIEQDIYYDDNMPRIEVMTDKGKVEITLLLNAEGDSVVAMFEELWKDDGEQQDL